MSSLSSYFSFGLSKLSSFGQSCVASRYRAMAIASTCVATGVALTASPRRIVPVIGAGLTSAGVALGLEAYFQPANYDASKVYNAAKRGFVTGSVNSVFGVTLDAASYIYSGGGAVASFINQSIGSTAELIAGKLYDGKKVSSVKPSEVAAVVTAEGCAVIASEGAKKLVDRVFNSSVSGTIRAGVGSLVNASTSAGMGKLLIGKC